MGASVGVRICSKVSIYKYSILYKSFYSRLGILKWFYRIELLFVRMLMCIKFHEVSIRTGPLYFVKKMDKTPWIFRVQLGVKSKSETLQLLNKANITFSWIYLYDK